MRPLGLVLLILLGLVTASGQNFPDPRGTNPTVLIVSDRFQRPFNTAAYAANDLVSDSLGTPLVFENVARANGGGGYIAGYTVTTNNPSVTNATFRLRIFSDSMATGAVDTATFNFAAAHDSTYLGYSDFALQTSGTASAIAATSVTNWNHVFWTNRNRRHLWGVLTATGAYTPIAGQWFRVLLHIHRF